MSNILDRIAARSSLTRFRPTNAREFFALRLAEKLGDAETAAHYAALTLDHSEGTILAALRKATENEPEPAERARRFHTELGAVGERVRSPDQSRLVAIKVDRRSVAVAIFVDDHLDYTQIRHLASGADKAEASAVGFVNWVLGNFEIGSAALERFTEGGELRRAALNRTVMATLREHALPVWELSRRELLDAYACPPLRARRELREVLASITWQMQAELSSDDQILDAAAIGLMVQTDRILAT